MDPTRNNSSRKNVCYYITGHGLGHATRSLELVRALLDTMLFNVHTVSHANESFFRNELIEYCEMKQPSANCGSYLHHNRCLDTGALQHDVFRVDPLGSLEKYHKEIHMNREDLIKFEVSWLQQQNIDLVLADATPLGCYAGYLAKAKVVLLSNFSWDFCYTEMLRAVLQRQLSSPEVIKQYETMVEMCVNDSSHCDMYLQYPGATPPPAGFDPLKISTVPMLSRLAKGINPNEGAVMNINKLRSRLNIDTSVANGHRTTRPKVLLLGFGGHSTTWNLQDSFLPVGWICLVLGAVAENLPSTRFIALPPNSYAPDYIHAADAVLGKIGYGFVSECISAGTVLVFVPRQDWPEEKYLQDLLCVEYDAGILMPQSDFLQGHWGEYITKAAAKKGDLSTPPWTIKPEHSGGNGHSDKSPAGVIISKLNYLLRDQ